MRPRNKVLRPSLLRLQSTGDLYMAHKAQQLRRLPLKGHPLRHQNHRSRTSRTVTRHNHRETDTRNRLRSRRIPRSNSHSHSNTNSLREAAMARLPAGRNKGRRRHRKVLLGGKTATT